MDLSDWIERRADFTPDKPAIRFAGQAISYAALAERIGRLASLLQGQLGVRRGDRVAFLGYNSPEMIALVFACARLGALLVPMNWRLAAPEHLYILNDSRPAAFFVEPDFTASVEEHRKALPPCRLIAFGDAPGEGWSRYDALLAAADADAARDAAVNYADPVLLVYTSGTTGVPKGAVLAQNAVLWNAVNSTHMHDMTVMDRVLTTLPLFHVGGLNIQTLPALHAGATVTLHAKFDPLAVFNAIEQDRITLTVLVPAQLGAMMALGRWKTADLTSLRIISTGSTLVPEALIRAVHARGIPVIQVYGSTETSPIATYLLAADADRKIGSAGKPAIHCAIRLVDETGADVDKGRSGEILVKGPNVMDGYWDDAEATAEALKDGWFHTGDVGHVDAEGFLFIDDRMKDMIISGGENIYPAALENILAECAELAEASVVGRPDPKWGEVAVVVAVKRDGATIDEAGVLARFDGRVARYKIPRQVLFVERLPRNAMGKVKKGDVRELVKGLAAASQRRENAR